MVKRNNDSGDLKNKTKKQRNSNHNNDNNDNTNDINNINDTNNTNDIDNKLTKTMTTDDNNDNNDNKDKRTKLKPWKIRPSNDEGIEVPKSKQFYKDMGNGVKALDVIIGKGIEPKPGSEIRLAYIALFPDGSIFDERTAVKKPFIFRKGIGQVIKGLDVGVKGLRIGGSREIIIPPEYG